MLLRWGNSQKLWRDNQTTLNSVSPQISFSNEQRFKLYSIYWPKNNNQDNFNLPSQRSLVDQMAKKISKIIDDQQKNQARKSKMMHNSLNKITTTHKLKSNILNHTKTCQMRINSKLNKIVNRLSYHQNKSQQSKLRDKFGNRCNLYKHQQGLIWNAQKLQMQKTATSSNGFQQANRIRLQLPENYYPGPGKYHIKRYLEEMEIRSHRK